MVFQYNVVSARSLLLTSFESYEDLNKWKVLGGRTRFEISDEYAMEGNSSAKISISKYVKATDENTENQYPGIYWDAQNGLPTDWSQFTRCTFDYYNPTSNDITVSINVRNTAGNRLDKAGILLKPGFGQIIIYLSDFDLQSIEYLRIYSWEPPRDAVYYVDDFRLANGPLSPQNCKAERLPNSSNIKISWEEPSYQNEDERAGSYLIYRGMEPGSLIPIDEVFETSWVDKDAEHDQRYYYAVASLNNMGIEGDATKEICVEKLGIVASFEGKNEIANIDRVGDVIVEQSTEHVTEGVYSFKIEFPKWQTGKDEYPGVEYKNISLTNWSGFNLLTFDYYNPLSINIPLKMRLKNKGNTWTTADWFYLLPGENTYVISLDGVTLDLTKMESFRFYTTKPGQTYTFFVDNVRLQDSIQPNTPSGLTVERINGTSEVKLNWEASREASDGDFATQYRIYRGSTTNCEEMDAIVDVDGTSLTWTDEDAPADVAYYIVTAVDKMKNESVPTPPNAIKAVGKISGCILVNGEPLTGASVSILELEKDYETPNGNFSIDYLMEGSYSIVVKYEGFRSILIRKDLAEGQELDLGDISLFEDKIPPNVPRNLVANEELYLGAILLTWDEPLIAEGEIEEDTESYLIYRSTSNDVKRNSENLVGESKITTWTDILDERQFGKIFFYAIVAVDGAGNESKATSNVVSVKVLAPPVPTIISPLGRELIKDTAPTLKWDGSQVVLDTKFLGYTIELSSDISFPQNKTKCIVGIEPNKEEYSFGEVLAQGTWYWRIRARFSTNVASEVNSSWSQVGEFVVSSMFDTTHLLPYINVYPNVLQAEPVVIRYLLTSSAKVTLRVFNLGGKLVSTILADEMQIPGEYSHTWYGLRNDNKEAYNGLYFIQLIAQPLSQDGPGKVTKQRKLVINR
jgi:fibronectin type 3 domain-containing protein